MEGLLYHRRKLLDFDHPLHKPYVRQLIPRYYSSFFPWFRTFNDPPCGRKDICTGVYHEEMDYPPTLKILPTQPFKVNWFLVIAVMYLLYIVLLI